MKRTLLTTSALIFGSIAVMPLAAAQTANEEGETSARTLDTVTVTATKREQTLQDVPVAVSVVDSTTIEQAEILDLGDLQALVPSLSVSQLQSSANTNFVIRGFGNGANNAGIEPSVGVFIDGVYRSRSAAQIADLPNLERVEVLRGPQSTLFGKNASAGVISIVTQAPQFEWGGSAEASVGNYGLMRAAADITGPISDTLAFSLAANANSREGYAEDLALGTDVNTRDRYGIRGQLLWQPSDTVSFRAIADFDRIDEECCVAANLVNGPTGAAIFALGGAIDPENPFSYEVFNNFDSTNEIENGGLSLQGDFETSWFDVVSITAYRATDLSTNQDSDFTSADLNSRNSNVTDIKTFTQEIRLTSNTENAAFDWMVGGFYFDEEVEIANTFFYGEDFRPYADILSGGAVTGIEGLLGFPSGTFFAADTGFADEQFGQDNTAWSIFGTVDWYMTDRLTATVGLNYTVDEKDAYGSIVSTDVFSAIDFVETGNTVLFQTAFAQTLAGFGIDATDPAQVAAFAQGNPAGFAQVQAGAQAFADANDTNPAVNPLLGLQPLQFLPPFVGYPNAVEDGNSEDDKVTYTARLAFDLTDNINVYGSVATGFKATSWNLSRDSRPFANSVPPLEGNGLATPNLVPGTRYAGPEESTVYELGLKAQFDTVAVNLAIFDQTIEGFQSNVFTGTGFALANAGEQSAQGFEFDVTWSPVEPLTIVAAGTFLDPVYDSFEESAYGDISGQQPSSIADTNLSLAGTYAFTIGNWDAFVRGAYRYESDAAFFDSEAIDDIVRATGVDAEINELNASFGVMTQDGFSVTLWGRNLTDDEYITTAFPSVAQEGSYSGYPNAPATYGVTVRKAF